MESEDDDDNDYVPGPGTYYIPRYYDKYYNEYYRCRGLDFRANTGRKDEWIGPEVSRLGALKRMKKDAKVNGQEWRLRRLGKKKDLIPTPGPGKYNPINVDLIQIKAPKYSFGRRDNNCLLKNKEDKGREKLKK